MSKRQQDLFESDPPPWELDDAEETLAASIVFSAPPHGPYDYSVPESLHGSLRVGCRVRVPLGRGNRRLIGYCVAMEHRTGGARLKPIDSLVDPRPLLSPTMIELARWIGDYYLCPWGQAIEAMVPAGVRTQAGTRERLFLSVPTRVAARITQLKLPDKQRQALTALMASSRPLTPPELAAAAGCTQGPITALRKKGLVIAGSQRVTEVEPEPRAAEAAGPTLELHPDQQRALDAILGGLQSSQHSTILLHGITGSGKTEVYIRAIEKVISFGRQAIVLVPEISLTPQTRRRFQSRFERVAVLHSNLTDPERHWHWKKIAEGQIQVVVGARSAIFAPTPHLGLIVLDEEHDASFKQDQAPRYHARQVALQRARAEAIPLVLGSATPSLESWYAAKQGEYQLVDMPERVLGRPLPVVSAIDLRAQYHDRHSRGAIGRPMQQAIRAALDEGGQVILLLNRRGFSTNIQCPACGHVVKCPDCDISLTHHREGERAICHYCDFEILAPTQCPECDFEGIRYSGLGTQRLEMEVRSRFRDVPCLRVDSDTMRGTGSHEEALDRFRSGEIRILLGTQMIAKGLDFPDVTLVGVINADTALHFPDFRAAERTFQLVTQVAGRTGRGNLGGRVLVQTFSPEHPAIQAAMEHDFHRFAREELPVREQYGYPPSHHLVRLVVRGESEPTTEAFIEGLADRIHAALDPAADPPPRVLGPAPAPIAKLRGKFRFHLILLSRDLALLRDVVRQVSKKTEAPDGVQWIVDVDPVDLL